MTNEQINAAIARALNADEHWMIQKDYCNNLNDMHEAEKALAEHQNESIYPRNLGAWRNPTKPIYATARQRAEAFLRTLGKWEEVQG